MSETPPEGSPTFRRKDDVRQLLSVVGIIGAFLAQGGLTYNAHGSLRDEVHETRSGVEKINLAVERLDGARTSSEHRIESVEARIEAERRSREELQVKVQALEVELARRK